MVVLSLAVMVIVLQNTDLFDEVHNKDKAHPPAHMPTLYHAAMIQVSQGKASSVGNLLPTVFPSGAHMDGCQCTNNWQVRHRCRIRVGIHLIHLVSYKGIGCHKEVYRCALGLMNAPHSLWWLTCGQAMTMLLPRNEVPSLVDAYLSFLEGGMAWNPFQNKLLTALNQASVETLDDLTADW